MLDLYGTPYTEALHVVERYRLLDYEAAKEAQERGEKENNHLPFAIIGVEVDPIYKGSGMQLQFTVEDEGVFTNALVSGRNLSARVGRMAGICLRRKPACLLRPKGRRGPTRG
jgi:hypothetical protein